MKTSWFLGPSGVAFSRALVGAAGSASFLIYVLPNTLFTDKYMEITQLYKHGRPVKVSEDVKNTVEATMNDLHWSVDKQKLVKLYTGYGFDLFHAGSFFITAKGVLGIPKNFSYKEPKDFDQNGVLVNNEPVAWGSPAGKALEESLVFSNEAKKFAIARELSRLETGEPFAYGMFSLSVILMCYALSSTVNRKFNFFKATRTVRATLYGIVSAFCYTTWVLCKDVSCVSVEGDVDKTVADVDESYARGGLEYYSKILQRNVALRSLMGKDGEDLFTAYGNDQVMFRTKHLAYTTRRDYMKTRVEEYTKVVEDNLSVKQAADETLTVSPVDESLSVNPAEVKESEKKGAIILEEV